MAVNPERALENKTGTASGYNVASSASISDAQTFEPKIKLLKFELGLGHKKYDSIVNCHRFKLMTHVVILLYVSSNNTEIY